MSGNLVVQGTTTTVNQEIVNTSIITSTSVSSPILNGLSTLALQTANTNALYINSNQQVGIGTTSPSWQLDVAQSSNADAGIQFTNSNTGTSAIAEFRASNGTSSAWFGIGGTGYPGYAQIRAGGASIYTSSAAGIGFSADNASGYITFGTGSSAPERMRIDSSGNLGLGTSSPPNYTGYRSFSLNNTAGSLIDIQINGASTGRVQSDSSQGLGLYTLTSSPMLFYTNNTERMRIDSSGNLLVGGTSQLTSSKLSVYGSAAVYNGGVDGTFAEGLNFVYNGNTAQYSTIKNSMSSVATYAGLQFWLGGAGTGTTQWLGYNLTRGQQQWYTNNSLAMTLNSSGQLGIGKTPSYPLHVNGTAAATAFLTGDIIMDNTDENLAPNEVDGTRGHWVLQEGDVNLFLINRITGKKYKFNITEVGE
jgi:hypothetical protein